MSSQRTKRRWTIGRVLRSAVLLGLVASVAAVLAVRKKSLAANREEFRERYG